jgi:hypothetical protein
MPDRLADLIASKTLNGIDFVEITSADQTSLRVHFLNAVTVQGTLAATNPVAITGGESLPAVPVLPVAATDWAVDDEGRPTLSLHTPFCGDFSFYTLRIDSGVLDPDGAPGSRERPFGLSGGAGQCSPAEEPGCAHRDHGATGMYGRRRPGRASAPAAATGPV